MLVLVGLSWVLGAAPCTELHLSAVVASDWRTVTGELRCRGPAEGLQAAVYPRLLRRPEGLDDVSRPWYYPTGFEPADMHLEVEGSALDGDEVLQALPQPSGDLVVTFVTRVPRRNGTFGRSRDALYLLGGWHPLLLPRQGPATPQAIHYDIELPAATAGFVGKTPFGRTSARRQRGVFHGRFLPLTVTFHAAVSQDEGGVVLRPLERPRSSARRTGIRDLGTLGDERATAEVHATLRDGRAFAEASGLPARPILVVVAPLRENLVEPFDGGLAVSDRIFQAPALHGLAALGLIPFELFYRYHRLALWRQQLFTLALPHARRRERDVWPELAADAVAAALRDRIAVQRYGDERGAGDFLETFAVIPEIESLIYAPQVSFVDAYFEAIDERRGRRLRLDDFAHELPRGKLLYEKLADRLGSHLAHRATDAYLAGRDSYVETVSRLGGAPLGPYLEQWLGPAPRIDYALGAVTHRPDGVEVLVTASGPARASLREVVEVEVEDEDGGVHRAQRLGPGAVLVPGAASADRVELDPRGRLVELEHLPGEGPRHNDRDPPRWRFLLNDINGLIAVTNQQISLSVNFSLRQVHDRRLQYDFHLLTAPESSGLAATAGYSFGGEVTPLRLSQRVGLRLLGQRLRDEAYGGYGGMQGSLSAYYVYDDRLSLYSSFEGSGVALRATQAYGLDGRDEPYTFSALGAAALHLFPLGFYDAILVRGRGDYAFGEVPPQERLRLGGRYTARGFETDEARADRRLIGSVEYRHALVVDARTDLFGMFTLTRIEAALFGDAVYLPVERSGCERSAFYDVGTGVRFLGDILSLAPGSLALDVGLPLSRCPDERDRFPLTVYLAFVQSYLVF